MSFALYKLAWVFRIRLRPSPISRGRPGRNVVVYCCASYSIREHWKAVAFSRDRKAELAFIRYMIAPPYCDNERVLEVAH